MYSKEKDVRKKKSKFVFRRRRETYIFIQTELGLHSWQWSLKRKAWIDQALPDKKISSLYKEFLNNYIVILVWRVFGFYTQTFIIIIIIMSKVWRKAKNADHLKFPLLYLFYFLKKSYKARDTAAVVTTHSEAYWCQKQAFTYHLNPHPADICTVSLYNRRIFFFLNHY